MAADSSKIAGLTGRYATALFELAAQRGVLDEVADDLVRLAEMIAQSRDLERLIRSPVLAREVQGRAVAAVLERADMSEVVRHFVGVVARNRRLFALAGMIRQFQALLARHRGEISAEVTSAKPLSERQIASLNGALSRAMGSDVTLAADVDEGLIGGLVVKVGSRLVDASIRTKLRNLELAMKGAV